MVEFKAGAFEKDQQTRTTQIRHSEKLQDLIDMASVALAVDKSVFLR